MIKPTEKSDIQCIGRQEPQFPDMRSRTAVISGDATIPPTEHLCPFTEYLRLFGVSNVRNSDAVDCKAFATLLQMR
jgi:hypothetical protein